METKNINKVEEFENYYNKIMKDESILKATVESSFLFSTLDYMPFSIKAMTTKGDYVYTDSFSIYNREQQDSYIRYFKHAIKTNGNKLKDNDFILFRYYIKNGNRLSMIQSLDLIKEELIKRKPVSIFAIHTHCENEENNKITFIGL